jgi:hypothetical protein
MEMASSLLVEPSISASADPCGNEYPGGCEVTYSGECLPIETFQQADWGIAGELPGNAVSPSLPPTLPSLTTMLANNPLTIGGSAPFSLTLTNAQCVVDLLPSSGWTKRFGQLPPNQLHGLQPDGHRWHEEQPRRQRHCAHT